MATSEIKTKMHDMIDSISDDMLQELLPILKDIQKNVSDTHRIEIAKRIIAENRPLLQKLSK